MGGLNDERLISLNEIAMDCFNVDNFALDANQPEVRIVVKPADIVRALETAYDIGLIAGFQLTRAGRSCS
jgi:hypothetical protein